MGLGGADPPLGQGARRGREGGRRRELAAGVGRGREGRGSGRVRLCVGAATWCLSYSIGALSSVLNLTLGKAVFAECQIGGTRQTFFPLLFLLFHNLVFKFVPM